LFLTYIISYFDTYDCTHNGDEPPKDRCAIYLVKILTYSNKCWA